MSETRRVVVKIAGQEFNITSTPEIADKIEHAARLVEEKIAAYQKSGETDVLRIYLMSAFHLAYDLMCYTEQEVTAEEIAQIKSSMDKLKIKVLNACKSDDKKRDMNAPS